MANDAAGQLSPEPLIQLGLGFWGPKAVLSAVELDLFTILAESGPLPLEALRQRLGLHPRGARDFFDTLVALAVLERDERGYRNTPLSDHYLDRNKQSYIGGLFEMANARLYPYWANLTQALRSGEPQNEARTGEDFFGVLYSDPQRLKQFLQAMTGVSFAAAQAIAAKFPFEKYQTLIDVGCAQGCVPVQVALRHTHLRGGGFDLPVVQPIFEDYVRSFGLSDRLRFYPGSFFQDALPPADVYVMGHILHDWNKDEKMGLLRKAYDALPAGGALIVYEAIIDDQRRSNIVGLLMSLNMLIETPGGFDYTGADACGWMAEVGFRETYVEHLAGPDSMVVGIK
ncbi:MAG TPA: methyltransferase [Terriglobales bacterium]|nr:methyltransferase [Terriglobales bacterium]